MSASPTIPPFWESLLHSVAQKVVAMIAATLITDGVLRGSDSAQFSEYAVGGLMLGVSFAWTWFRDRLDHRRALALAAAPPFHPKETATMNLQDAFDALATKAKALETLAEEAWNALPPGFQHPALDALKTGVADVATAATVEADKVAPPSLDAIIAAGVAAIQADADAKIAALQAVKTPVAA